MALKNYGVLKGRPISRRLGSGSSPHFQIRVVDEAGTDYRVAVGHTSSEGVPGFAVHRTDHTEGEAYWLKGDVFDAF